MSDTLLRAQNVANKFLDGGWPSWVYPDELDYPDPFPGDALEVVGTDTTADNSNVSGMFNLVTYALPALFIEHDLSVIPVQLASDEAGPDDEDIALLLESNEPYLVEINKLSEMGYQELLDHEGNIMPFDLPWVHLWIDKFTGETNTVNKYGSVMMLYQPHEAVILEIDCSICPEDAFVSHLKGRKPSLEFTYKLNSLAHVFNDPVNADKQAQRFIEQRGRQLQAEVKANTLTLQKELESLEERLLGK